MASNEIQIFITKIINKKKISNVLFVSNSVFVCDVYAIFLLSKLNPIENVFFVVVVVVVVVFVQSQFAI